MSQLTKQQLKGENQTQFPNNNVGAITPSNLRAFNVDMIDSTVNQTDFTSFSGSVAGEISTIQGEITALENFSASLSGGFVTEGELAAATQSLINQINTKLDTTTFNSYTQSNDDKWNTLGGQTGSFITESETGSFATSAITASSLVTASFDNGTRNLTFTKGDASTFAVNIPDVSGSTFNTGSFATTGSNTFTDNQTINGNISTSGADALTVNGYINTRNISGQPYTYIQAYATNAGGVSSGLALDANGSETFVLDNGFWNKGITLRNLSQNSNVFTVATGSTSPLKIQRNTDISGSLTASLQQGYAWVGDGTGRSLEVPTSSFAGGTIPAGTISSSAQITDLGFVSSSITASSLITASVSLNTITFTKGDASTFNITVNTGSDGQTFSNPTLNTHSGSLILAANNTTSASFTYITASNNGQVNLIWKNRELNGSTYVTGSSNIFAIGTSAAAGRYNYIGGSSNVFLTTFTANNTNTLPTITGSAATIGGVLPAMNGNIFAGQTNWGINPSNNPGIHNYNSNLFLNGGATFNMVGNVQTTGVANTGRFDFTGNNIAGGTVLVNSPSRSLAEINAGATGSFRINIANNTLTGLLTYNGPVSGSAIGTHAITNNAIAGILTMNVQSQSRAITLSQNNINGNLSLTDNTVFAPTLGSTHTISNNSIGGTLALQNRASSSFTVTNNIVNGAGITIACDLDTSLAGPAGTNRRVDLQSNTVFGFTNNVYFSGSMGAVSGSRGLVYSIIGGQQISASLVGDGGDKNIVATTILGNGLNVIGSSPNLFGVGYQNYGSAFFGRWNATDGNRAKTAETVFAVGTGNSGSAGIVRKTGFLIDSGSNSFFEGTLNVSGSTTLSGSTFISNLQDGVTDVLVTYDTTTGELRKATAADILSASFDAAEFWSTITQSGSAGVSGSITFNNSGSVSGISVVNNTQITVAQAGTYNIQFSAQLETSAGADTIHLWFKKNGTNITDSASKAVLANNTAQVLTVNILDVSIANDYYELAYQTTNGNATILYEPATGNIPTIPSVILTVTQIR